MERTRVKDLKIIVLFVRGRQEKDKVNGTLGTKTGGILLIDLPVRGHGHWREGTTNSKQGRERQCEWTTWSIR